MNEKCTCDMCLNDMANYTACQKKHRDEMAERVMQIMLTTEHWMIQGGSGGGGLENQTDSIAFAAYAMADAMIAQSKGKGIQRVR